MPNQNKRTDRRLRMHALSAAISLALPPLAVTARAAENELEEVVVTGSRITRFEGDYVAPVLSLGVERMRQSGKTNVEEFVSEVGSLVGSAGSHDTQSDGGGSQAGINALNLRNLGTARTLVLVNGRRHVSSIATGEPLVDTNTIPVALIERIDILTGGASAVYGADAVSGAVNFILKDDFEGFSTRMQGGTSGHGDAEEYFASFVGGHNFDDGRANLTVSYEYRKQDRLETFDRDYGLEQRQYLVNNPAEFRLTDDPNVPDRILSPPGSRRYIFTAPDGRYDILGFDTAAGRDLEFGERALTAEGAPFDAGTPINGFASIGGDGTPTAYFSSSLIPELETHSINVLGRYDINSKATAFGEFKYVSSDAVNPRNSSFTSVLELTLDNPFIPDAFDDYLDGIDDASVNLARDDLEMRSLNDNNRDTWRAVVGVRGDITDWLNYEVSLNYGRTEVTARLTNQRLEDRYFAAMDAVIDPATGEPTCRSNLDPTAVPNTDAIVSSWNPGVWGDSANMTFTPGPDSGCVPFNPFIDGTAYYFDAGSLNPNDPNAAAQAFITGGGAPLIDSGEIEQTVFNAYIAGNTSGVGLELPAGPIDFVFGGEFREESVSNTPDPIRSNPNGLTPLSFVRPSSASYDVAELFTEVSVPVFEDLGPLLQGLRFDAAYRFSDYSTVGSTSAYSFGANWTLSDSVILRGSFGRSVRAPNLNELFSPDNEGSFRPEDPCEQANLPFQTSQTVANCRAELSSIGIDPDTFVSASPVGRPGLIGGNPDLEEETSDAITFGIVLSPSFVDGLVATVDYWEIELSDGVLYPSDDEIVERCYDSPSLDNQFCELFTRATDGIVGVIVDLQQRPVNVSSLITSGIDFGVSWSTELGNDLGALTVALNGTWLESLQTQPTVAPTLVEETGLDDTLLGEQAPEWVANINANWMRGPFSATYRLRYQSGVSQFTDQEIERQPDLSSFVTTDDMLVHDLQGGFALNGGVEIYAGVNNLTDQEPDPTYLNIPVGPRGRYFYAGVSIDIERMNFGNPFR